jgi:hypothetical protein
MDFQIKLFSWQDQGNHLIIIARGIMDVVAYRSLLEEIAARTRLLDGCKVLVDLSDSISKLEANKFDALVGEYGDDYWPMGNKIAFVSGNSAEDYHQTYLLRIAMCARGVKAGAFRDAKVAIDWLAGTIAVGIQPRGLSNSD